MKKCKEGHYYCYQDSKCKPIPKGYRRGVGGYLRREREDEKEDSKKNGNGNGKSNGSSNGNGNGGNGSGNGNGGSGGNGGGNGSGGVGESVEIQNSDGETTAVVVDIVGPAHMKPAVDGNGVWKGTQIDEKKKYSGNAIFPFKANVKIKNEIISDDGISTKNNKKLTDEYLPERKMTEKEKRKDDRLKKKYDKSDMKKSMQKQYGKEEGKKVYFATIRKQAMEEEKKKDHEPEMIRSQLKTAKRASKRIKKHTLKKDNFKAWVQSKITKASDYLDTAADYLDSKDVKEASSPAQQAAIAINMKKEGKKPKIMKEGSLRKWFKGSKSKDGKGGWVNVVTGGTCASDEPGEGTPKCVSSAKRASMSKKERLSAARRKKKADPNQQSKRGAAKPTYVSTDKKKSKKKKKKMKEEFISLPLQLEVPQSDGEFKLGLMFRESLEQDRGMLFIFENTDHHSFHMKNTFIPLDIAFINEEGVIESIKELDPLNPIPVYPNGEIRYAVEVNRGWFAENGVVVGDILLEDIQEHHKKDADGNTIPHEGEELNEVKDKKGKGSGTKDACYHKVKSRYSVWPSAYASGALVKCRKVGAANWGNSSKKEEVEYNDELTEGKVKAVQLALKFGAKALKKLSGKAAKPTAKVLTKGKKLLPTLKTTKTTGVDLYKGGKRAVAGMEIVPKTKGLPPSVGAMKNPMVNKPTIKGCLLYTSTSPRDKRQSRMPSSA